MNKTRSAERKIPAILSIPEKVYAVLHRVSNFRLPLYRSFSGIDIIILLGAAILLLLTLFIRPLSRFKMFACILSVLLCFFPIGTDAWKLLRKRSVPAEEITIVLAVLSAILIGEYVAAAVFMLFVLLFRLSQGYAMLHREAELDHFQDEKAEFYEVLKQWDAEKSRHGALISTVCLGVFSIFVLLGIVYLLLAVFHLKEPGQWLHGAMISLALASPAAACYTSRLIHFGTACSAARADILYSDDQVPEDYRSCKLFAFSKTGTVTDGRFVVSEVAPVGISEDELLIIAALAECRSAHPIAKALREASGMQEGSALADLLSFEEIPGKGISTFYAGHQIYVGNGALLDDHGIWFAVPAKSGSAIHVAVDNSYRGYIMISDTIRDGAFDALEEWREAGASTLVMLTGDVRSTARSLASAMNFDMVKPELTPDEKGAAVKYLRSVHGDNAHIACVGDGFQDAEMFQQSDISVCLEAREDCSSEVRIFSGDILCIPKSYRICRKAAGMLIICLAAAAAVKLILLIIGMHGLIPDPLILASDSLAGTALTVYSLLSFRID